MPTVIAGIIPAMQESFSKYPRVAVVGGGPAGLMAAETLRAAGVEVDLYEAQGSVGRRFLIAGKGGLNLTHSESRPGFDARYRERAGQVGRWLDDLDANALREWARGLGVETFVGSSGRVFSKEEILASAGSRYTYSANTLAIDQALEEGFSKLALVGMSCQSSVPPVMWHRKVGKIGKPFLFNIGLLCSKTFDDAIFPELFEAKYGLAKQDMVKMNIKGVFQIWMKDGSYHEINLKECHAWTREGCTHCPDFAAEHADVSTGGIGKDNDWTLTVVRTDLGREVISRMIDDGSIIARPADEDPGAIKLMHKLSEKSRDRWPQTAVDFPKNPAKA